jgi:hypothetical protein
MLLWLLHFVSRWGDASAIKPDSALEAATARARLRLKADKQTFVVPNRISPVLPRPAAWQFRLRRFHQSYVFVVNSVAWHCTLVDNVLF